MELVVLTILCVLLGLCSIATAYFKMPLTGQICDLCLFSSDDIDPAVSRQVERRRRKHSTPLTQRWYRGQQQHLSKKQKAVTRLLWPTYGLMLRYNESLNSLLDPIVGHETSIVLDIGFGSGESLTSIASDPQALVVGCELHRASLAKALDAIHSLDLRNVRLYRGDAGLLLSDHINSDSLSLVQVFFPDPWPNSERDGCRRVVRPATVLEMLRTLRIGGLFRIATDSSDYANHVLQVMEGCKLDSRCWRMTGSFQHSACSSNPEDRPPWRPITRYERKAKESLEAGGVATIWNFEYTVIMSQQVES